MRISLLSKGAVIAVALCLAPAVLTASPKAAGQGVVTVNPEAAPGDTTSLLEQIRVDAIGVKNDADQLQMLTREGYQAGWEADASLLEDIRAHVNEMNKLLYNLRVNQAETSSLQQAIIERIAPPAVELAGTTQGAIATLNNNESRVFMSNLPALASDIYNEASRVAQTVGNFDKYSHSVQEEQQLKQALGL